MDKSASGAFTDVGDLPPAAAMIPASLSLVGLLMEAAGHGHMFAQVKGPLAALCKSKANQEAMAGLFKQVSSYAQANAAVIGTSAGLLFAGVAVLETLVIYKKTHKMLKNADVQIFRPQLERLREDAGRLKDCFTELSSGKGDFSKQMREISRTSAGMQVTVSNALKIIRGYKEEAEKDKESAARYGYAGASVAAAGAFALACPPAAPVVAAKGVAVISGKAIGAAVVTLAGAGAAGFAAWTYVQICDFEDKLDKYEQTMKYFDTVITTCSNNGWIDRQHDTDENRVILQRYANDMLALRG